MKKETETQHKTKIKLVKLYEILLKKSDIENSLTTQQILKELAKENIVIDRRVLATDIEVLTQEGYNIKKCRVGHSNAYYLSQERLNSADSRMILDAIQAARFITEEQTGKLIKKISERLCTGDDSEATELVRFNTRKSHNSEVQENIKILEETIRKGVKASFVYFDLDENHCRKYRKNRDRYVVEPIALIYQEDFYYIMTWNPKHSDVTNYRIDRISEIKAEAAPISDTAKMVASEQKALNFTNEAINMFGGMKKRYVIVFEDSLLGAVYDRFGENLSVRRTGENTCEAEIEILESPTWKGWLAQFEGRMKIKEQ